MPKTVLIVEDDEDARSIFSDVLTARGYRVLIATQGAEGVHLARRHRPDLILLDIRMPVMNGMGAAWYLRAYPETRDIPICAVSAYSLEEDEPTYFNEMAFDCFLMKPIDPSALLAEVEALIGPPDLDLPPEDIPVPE